MQNPSDGKYRTRSAITNPTLKNMLEATENGIIKNETAMIRFLKRKEYKITLGLVVVLIRFVIVFFD